MLFVSGALHPCVVLHRGKIPGKKIQAHKNSVLRSRVEARERVAHTASLEAEVERLRALLKGMEDELAGRRYVFYIRGVKDELAGKRSVFCMRGWRMEDELIGPGGGTCFGWYKATNITYCLVC